VRGSGIAAPLLGHLRSNVVAYIALFFALGLGTAWALERDSVKSKHVKNESLKGADIKDEKLTGADVTGLQGADIDEASLAQVPSAADAGTLDGTDSSGFLKQGSPAGGDLSGTYPNPELGQDTVTPLQLNQIPTVHAESDDPINVTNASVQVLSFNAERYDTAPGMHSTTTNPTRLTAPVIGDYLVTANVAWTTADTDGKRDLFIYRNGDLNETVAKVSQTGTETPIQSVSTVTHMFAGDFLEVGVTQTSGSTLQISDTDEYSPEFTLNFIAPVTCC
jgi:hypothetical protein